MFRIMVIEDDAELRRLFCTVLRKSGYQTVEAADGNEALELLEHEFVDLIISDIMMPQLDGISLLHTLREVGVKTPVLIVTAKEHFTDLEDGFRAGADDYMVKPINVHEMVLRVGALLRRSQSINERRLSAGSTMFEYDSLTVYHDGTESVLPQKEFLLIYKLIASPNHIFTRQQLMDEIWGMESKTELRTVDVHIGRLREKFKDNPDFEIVTIRGLGYKAVKRA